jgi:membrane-associated phospholipid phosphatase
MGLDMVPELAILSVGAGIIAWSRLRLNAHNPFQIVAGLVAGLISSLIFVWWY